MKQLVGTCPNSDRRCQCVAGSIKHQACQREAAVYHWTRPSDAPASKREAA